MEEGLKSGFDNGERSAFDEEFKRHCLSFYELSDTLGQVDFLIRFLGGLIFRLAQHSNVERNSSIRILRDPDEITGYIFKYEADFVMLTSPQYMPVVIKRKDFGWIKDKDEFADWLMVHWRTEMLVVMVI